MIVELQFSNTQRLLCCRFYTLYDLSAERCLSDALKVCQIQPEVVMVCSGVFLGKYLQAVISITVFNHNRRLGHLFTSFFGTARICEVFP